MLELQDPRPRMMRRVIIDMLPYAVPDVDILTMQERLGLVPSSPEVLAMDRMESNTRIANLRPVSDVITQMGGWSAEAIAEYFLMQMVESDDEPDDEHPPIEFLRNLLVTQNKNVIVTAVHGIVSHLIASGVLVYNKELMT